MVRRTTLIAVVVLVAVNVGTVPASARPERRRPPPPALECGTLPAGDVRLTGDLTCTEPFVVLDRSGYERPWDDRAWDQLITIDLGGHALDISAIQVPCLAGYRTREKCGILGPYRIINGTIIGNLGSVAQLENAVVHGVVYLGSTQGPYDIYADNHITGSWIVDGFIRVGFDATIQRNVLLRSMIDQDLHQVAMRDLRILDNIVVSSPEVGIDIAPTEIPNDIGGVVARNIVIGSRGPGFRFWATSEHFAPIEVRDNIAWANDGDGFFSQLFSYGVDPYPRGGPLTVSGNLAVANAGHGINITEVVPERAIVVDGGGNRAIANRAEPACIGVVCSVARS